MTRLGRVAIAGVMLASALRSARCCQAQTAYITNLGDDSISVIDTKTGAVAATITATGTMSGVAVSANGAKLYVASGQNQRRNTIVVFDTATRRTLHTIQVGDTPGAVAASPDEHTIFSVEDNKLTVIDAATDTILRRLDLPTYAASAAVSPDSRTPCHCGGGRPAGQPARYQVAGVDWHCGNGGHTRQPGLLARRKAPFCCPH